jgi:2-iminobutanoate/2-iminopropanoate deaminase
LSEEGSNMRDVISTKDSPAAIGPFSQAIRANGLVFLSGQVAVDPATGRVIDGDAAAQTERILRNVAAVLAAAGSGLDRVVRAGVYLADLKDYAAMNAVYGRFFAVDPPARTTVEVSRLPLDAAVEIDVVALS